MDEKVQVSLSAPPDDKQEENPFWRI